MTHSRKQEHHSGSRPQTLSPSSCFDPGNLAIARARENFNKARALTPHRQSGGSNSPSISTNIYPRSESGAGSPPTQTLGNASSGASVNPSARNLIPTCCVSNSDTTCVLSFLNTQAWIAMYSTSVRTLLSTKCSRRRSGTRIRLSLPSIHPFLHPSLSLSLSVSRIRRAE